MKLGLSILSLFAAAAWGRAGVVSLDVYEVYTELTVLLDKPVPFTCEAGADAGTLVLTVSDQLPFEALPAVAGRITDLRTAPSKGATTFFVKTSADAGVFRAYATKEPPTVVLDVFRRLDLSSSRPEPAFKKFLAGRKLLMVDDDDGPVNGNKYSVDVDGKYRAALDKLKLDVDEYVVRAGQNGPSAEVLSAYPLVVWFTGLDARPAVITGADETSMSAYVLNGGRLLLVSQNYISDSGGGKSRFGKDILGITSFKADTQVAVVTAGPRARLPISEYLLNTELTIIGNWGDGFKTPDEDDAFFNTADGFYYGAVRSAGEGRVAFFSCAIENVGYVGRLADILQAALDDLTAE